MNKYRIIFIVVLVFLSSLSHGQCVSRVVDGDYFDKDANSNTIIDTLRQIDYAIIGGDNDKYDYYLCGYGIGRIYGTITYEKKLEMLLYSFIMAEKYKDRHAAYDFAETIMEDFLERGVEMDSLTSHIVLDYLLMAVGDGTSPFTGAEHLAAMKIYQLLCRNPWLRDEAKAAKFKEEVMNPIVKKYVNRPRKH